MTSHERKKDIDFSFPQLCDKDGAQPPCPLAAAVPFMVPDRQDPDAARPSRPVTHAFHRIAVGTQGRQRSAHLGVTDRRRNTAFRLFLRLLVPRAGGVCATETQPPTQRSRGQPRHSQEKQQAEFLGFLVLLTELASPWGWRPLACQPLWDPDNIFTVLF